MEFLSKAVIQKPVFEKIAELELSKDITDWNEEIMNQFFETMHFLPKEIGVDIVIKNVDENSGYAKGSVVVFSQEKKINFPIIVKEYKLSPFDVFVAKKGDNYIYMNANEHNVKKELMPNDIASVENMYDPAKNQDVKSVGGIIPKPSVPINDAAHDLVMQDQGNYALSKMSSWVKTAHKEDLEKLAIQMAAQKDVMNSFHDNTGDLITNIIDLPEDDDRTVLDSNIRGELDLTNVVKAKQALVAIDSEFMDHNSLIPIKAPSVCELRMTEFPSMEDFIESGETAMDRLKATKVGKPISGIVFDLVSPQSDGHGYCEEESSSSEIKKRKRQPQIFISADGNFYNEQRDYDRNGISFYGTNVMETAGLMGKIIENAKDKNVDDFLIYNPANRGDGSDKLFNPIANSDQGLQGDHWNRKYDSFGRSSQTTIYCIYGSGDAWECAKFGGSFRKYDMEGRPVYASKDVVVIPSNVVTVQKVDSVQDPVYKMVVGKCENIFLVPEGCTILSQKFMKELSYCDLMHPSKSVRSAYEEANIEKVSMYLGNQGYVFEGDALAPLYKLAGLEKGVEFGTKQATQVLGILGVSADKSKEIMKVALNRASENGDSSVHIYGVNGDYINQDFYADMEKNARNKEVYKKMAAALRIDLVKEASVLEDPEAVDVVLSLNFVNEDNLKDYVDNIQQMRKIISKLSGMIVASRMGLSDLEESAARKAIDGLESTVEGLEKIKLALGT